MSDKKHITKAAGIIGAFTLLSRVLGFVRDCVIAKLFGTAASAQAFVIAFTIPNMLRDLVAEGAANAAFVPVLSEYKIKQKKEEFWRLAGALLNIILIALMLISILGIFLAPLIVRIIAPGFISQPEKLNETIKLLRIMFPYILLIGLAAYGAAVLNSLKHFSAPAFGPCLMNIAMIVVPLVFAPRMRESSLALAIAVLAGGVLQLSIQIPVLYKKGLRPKWRFGLRHPMIGNIGRLLIPRALSSSVYQLNIIVNRACSSLTNIVGEGAPAALYYANRLFQFPLAIFGIALAQAALPTLSEQAQEETLERFKQTVSFTLRLIFFVCVPAAAGLIILRTPITQILFQRGRFDAYSTQITQTAVLFYSLGLVFYAGNNVLASSFYSLKDTRTPVKAAVIALVFNIFLNLALMKPLKVGGLALSTALSGGLNFSLLIFYLRRKIGAIGSRRIIRDFIKALIASLIMAVVIFILKRELFLFKQDTPALINAFYLLISLSIAVLTYFVASLILKADQMVIFFSWLLKKYRFAVLEDIDTPPKS